MEKSFDSEFPSFPQRNIFFQALKEKWWKTKGECLDQGEEDYDDLAASLVEEDGEDLGLYLHGAGASLSVENMGSSRPLPPPPIYHFQKILFFRLGIPLSPLRAPCLNRDCPH